MELKSGYMISHYRLVDKIGAGGMGIVWSALDTRLKRHVAIKILPPELTSDAERRLRFEREAQTAAALSHPNIAVIHEVGEHEGVPYLVMELLKGKTLRDAVGRRPLPVKQWIGYARPIAEGLAHAHKNGIVHRDLKTTNVMITEDGHIKLLDFGLAKLLEPPSSGEVDSDIHTRLETISRELTRAGNVLGTVAYMSPEQARGEPVDHRSDIFSFGVLLYEMASGRLPFKGNTDIESLNATLTLDPPPLGETGHDIPTEAERIVTKAMEKEPGRRYQHADDMVTDFRNLKRDIDSGRVSIVGLGTGRTQAATAGPTPPTGSGPTSAAYGTGPDSGGTGAASGETAGGAAAGTGGRRPWVPGAPGRTRLWPWMVAAAGFAIVIAAVFVISRIERGRGASADGDAGRQSVTTAANADQAQRIVVLPFENLGPPEDEFFAAGVTEEIINRLASVRDLSVISRTSAFQYDKSGKTLQQIGRDFGVDYILDGTVRWARIGGASRVRISPQLVRVNDDTGVWGETYDSPMDDIFGVQTDIAGKVIDALGVVLLAPERASLEAKPTENQEAYRAYLKGMDALITTPTEDLAEQMFQRAVDLDPSFAVAWAGLSRAHSWRYHGGDRAHNRCEKAKEAADEALRLAPDAPEAHMALGLYYYRCFRDYNRAIAEVDIAARHRPNGTDVISWKATFNKRQGNLDEAVRLNERVMELDPMDFTSASELGYINLILHRYPESQQWFDRAIAIAPDVPGPYAAKAALLYTWKGETAEARAVLEAMPSTDQETIDRVWYWQEYFEGRYEDALARAHALPEISEDQTTLNPRASYVAAVYEAMGDPERARESWEQAVAMLTNKLRESPDDFRAYSDLGIALAALGRSAEAVDAATRAIELMPSTKDAEAALTPRQNLARVYTLLGDFDAAFAELEQTMAGPTWLSVPLLRVDPSWEPITNDPRFEAMAQRYETRL